MPNVRGDKRRTIVMKDEPWNRLGAYADEHAISRGAVIRGLVDDLLEMLDNAEASDQDDAADA